MRTVNFLLPALMAAPLASASQSTVHELLAQGKFCSATALAVSRACSSQTADDYWIGVGICINESKPDIFIGNALTHSLRILFGWGKETKRLKV